MQGLVRLALVSLAIGVSCWVLGSPSRASVGETATAQLTESDLKGRFGGQTQTLYCIPYLLCDQTNVMCPSSCTNIGQRCLSAGGGTFIDERIYDHPEDCTTGTSTKLCTVQTETSVLCYKWRVCDCVAVGLGGECQASGNQQNDCRNRLTDRDGCKYTFCQ